MSTALKRSRKKRRGVSLEAKRARAGWLFVLPFVIGLIVIYLPIIYDSIKFSFSEIEYANAGAGYSLKFVGLANYQEALFTDTNFVQSLMSGLGQMLIDIPAIVIFSLFIAILLNQKMAGRAAFRAIFFVPVILCTGLISDIDKGNMLLQYMGDTSQAIATGGEDTVAKIVNATDIAWLFSSMKVGTELVGIVTQLINSILDIINRSGVQMLIFLAGLQSISPAIYEACSIDGASAWETFWKITIPMISPMILVNTIYTVIDSFTSSSNIVMSYITSVSATGSVVTSAMAWIYFLIVIVLIGVVSALLSAFIFYQKRD